MSHPHNEHRAHKVEKRRVEHITKGYASGGAVHSDEAEDKALIKAAVKKTALKMGGKEPKHRADRKRRASGGAINQTADKALLRETRKPDARKHGGRVKAKGTTVNVIMPPAHAAGGAPMMPPMAPPPGAGVGAPPPMPPRPMMPPPVPQGMPPPGVPPMAGVGPAGPIRNAGGRAYAKGGAVRGDASKSGPGWIESMKTKTPVQHAPGKNDLKDMGRGKPITYKAGGAVEHPLKGGMGPDLEGGAGGGEARLEKEKRARREYAKA